MKKLLVLLIFVIKSVLCFSQFQIIDELTPYVGSRCFLSLEENMLVIGTIFSSDDNSGGSVIMEYTSELKKEKVFNFDDNNVCVHISIRENMQDYLLLLFKKSEGDNELYYYTATLSADFANFSVVDSLRVGNFDGNLAVQALDSGENIEYYFTLIASTWFSPYIIKVDKHSGKIITSGIHTIVNNGNIESLFEIKDVEETATHKFLSNKRRLYFLDKQNSELINYYDFCWPVSDNFINDVDFLNFTITEDSTSFVLAGHSKLATTGNEEYYSVGSKKIENLEPIYCENQPELLYIYESEPSSEAFINALSKNYATGEIWSVGSTSNRIYLSTDFPNDFDTKIITHKFNKDGEHLFQKNFPTDAHTAAWDCVATPDGGLAIVGSYYDYNSLQEYRGFIMKLTQDGELLPTSTEGVNAPDEITVFPNPTTGKLHITLPQRLFYASYKVEIFNTLGQRVLQMCEVQEPIIDVKNLANGGYILSVTTEEGRNYYTKFEKF